MAEPLPSAPPLESFVFPLLSLARHWRWWLDRRLKPEGVTQGTWFVLAYLKARSRPAHNHAEDAVAVISHESLLTAWIASVVEPVRFSQSSPSGDENWGTRIRKHNVRGDDTGDTRAEAG